MKSLRAPARFAIVLSLVSSGARVLAADDLPKAETILDKYVEVTGGKAAYGKLHTTIATGSVEFAAMGMKGAMTVWAAEPDKVLAEIVFEGLGKFREGSNGEVAWGSNAMQGPRIKEGDEKTQAMLQGTFNAEARWREIYKSANTVGVESVDGKDCYKILLTTKSGNPVTRWYDKASNLLVKSSMVMKSPMGEIEADSTLADYRKEGEILVPHKTVAHAAGQELIMTIEKVQANAEIPKGTFDVPDEVKALVKPAAK